MTGREIKEGEYHIVRDSRPTSYPFDVMRRLNGRDFNTRSQSRNENMTALEYGLLAALGAVAAISALTPNPKHHVPICPTGTSYVPSDEMCIPGAVNPSRWEWQ